MNNNGYGVLIHYASPYYDPVKAHEYYEQHKHLKGRKGSSKPSTSMLNERGKEAAKYVKEQIQNERKSRVEASKNTRDTSIQNRSENTKQNIEMFKNGVNEYITSLRDSLKNMSKEEKAEHREEISSEISRLRQNIRDHRTMLNGQLRYQKEQLRETHKSNVKQYKDEATSKYESELAKMVEDPEFKKTTKSKKSSSKGSGSSNLVYDEKTKKYK